MFSSRIGWNSGENRLTGVLTAKRKRGAPILDLTESNPTRVGFSLDAERVRTAVASPDILDYNPDPKGPAGARAAIAAYYRDQGAMVDPETIFLTAGTSEAYAFVFKLFCDPGDEVLFPSPSYPLFDFLAGLDLTRVRPYRSRYDAESGWRVDLAALEDAIGGRSRAIVTVNPNNPTGAYLSAAERGRTLALCRRFDLALIADEVFLDYAAPESRDVARTLAGNAEALTFVLSGLSKIRGLPQLKLGWIQVSGPDAAVREAIARLELIVDTYLTVSASAQAAASLLATREVFQDQALARIAENEAFLRETAANRPDDMVVYRREGGWQAVFSLRDERSDEAIACETLETENVLAHPGYFYDLEGPWPCLVCGLLTRPEIFREGVARISRTNIRN